MSKCNGAGYQLPRRGRKAGVSYTSIDPDGVDLEKVEDIHVWNVTNVEKHWTCLCDTEEPTVYLPNVHLEPLHGESPNHRGRKALLQIWRQAKLPPIALKQITKQRG